MTGAALLAAGPRSRPARAASTSACSTRSAPRSTAAPELMWRRTGGRAPTRRCSSTVVCGCGGGERCARCCRGCSARGRLVLDADALNAIAADRAAAGAAAARARRGRPTVLTPHPLEAARLLGSRLPRVQADRLAAAQSLAERFAAWCCSRARAA
jgi:NAD(P)H-hydrate repair Nnr-like enzyme with NAD(P)H-hydrate dehydratase domain